MTSSFDAACQAHISAGRGRELLAFHICKQEQQHDQALKPQAKTKEQSATWKVLLQRDCGGFKQGFLLQVVHATCKKLDGHVVTPVCGAVATAQHVSRPLPAMRLHGVLALEAHAFLRDTSEHDVFCVLDLKAAKVSHLYCKSLVWTMLGFFVLDAIFLLPFWTDLHMLDRLTSFGNMASENSLCIQTSSVGTVFCTLHVMTGLI